jgi:4-amino-4-deoxy-L-arabinose transferase-like glycosyltransferase
MTSNVSPGWLLAMAAVAIVAASLTLHRLDAADVCGYNEAVEGLSVQQMVEHGAILFPLLNGRDPVYKPPLFHWTATALDRVLGIRKVTTFNLRLPSALYATAGVILTMAFAADAIGPAGAVLAGIILAGSYQYVTQGRIGRVDMTLTFFETLALFSFLWWYLPRGEASRREQSGEQGALYLFGLALGLAVLSKGPVGAFLPLASIGVFLIVERNLDRARAMLRPGPVILALVVGSSWYVACLYGRRYGFLNRQLGSENFGRFFGSLGAMPPWYYVVPILLNSPPLGLLVPIAVVAAVKPNPLTPFPNSGKGDAEYFRARTCVRLLAIFWIVSVVFFSIAAYKRRAYLLPLWPCSAVMIAWWIETIRTNRFGRLLRPAVVAICVGLIAVNFAWLPKKEIKDCGDDSQRGAATDIARVVGPDEPLFIYGIEGDYAPLLFYLDRDAPPLSGKLGDAPPGYVIVPADVWAAHQHEALGLEPVLTSHSGQSTLILLHRGRVLAGRFFSWLLSL